MFTSHGHQILGTTADPKPPDLQVARCGGPGLCGQCSREVAAALSAITKSAIKTYHSNEIQVLVDQLEICIDQIDNQIAELYRHCEGQDHTPFQMRTPKGDWILIGLLSAKANALAALFQLTKGRIDAEWRDNHIHRILSQM